MSFTVRLSKTLRKYREKSSRIYSPDQLQWIVPSISDFSWSFCGIIALAADPCSGIRYALCRRPHMDPFDVIGSVPWPQRSDQCQSLYMDSHNNDACLIAAKFFMAATMNRVYVPGAANAEELADLLRNGKYEVASVSPVSKSSYEIVFFIEVPWAPEAVEMYRLARKLWPSTIQWKQIDRYTKHVCKFKCTRCDRYLVDG